MAVSKKPPLLSPPAVAPAAYRYFVNAWVDFAFIGGLSVLLYFILGSIHLDRTRAVIELSIVLAWLGNWPHFAATNYRLYHSKENILQYPITAIVLPFIILAAIACSFAFPNRVAPYLVKLYLFWSPYHFSGQTLGISMIYAKRAGFVFGRLERMALAGFIFGSFFFPIALGEVGPGTRSFLGISLPKLNLPPIVPAVGNWYMLICGAVFLVLIVRWCRMNRRMVPAIVLLPAVTQYLWFLWAPKVPGFNELVPFFHGVQYLFIAWAMQLKEKMDLKHIPPSPRYVFSETSRWWLCNVVMGGAMFWLFPRITAHWGYDFGFTEPVIISGLQIHHFFVDGVIWKLRNQKVGSPLLVNLEQLTQPELALKTA